MTRSQPEAWRRHIHGQVEPMEPEPSLIVYAVKGGAGLLALGVIAMLLIVVFSPDAPGTTGTRATEPGREVLR